MASGYSPWLYRNVLYHIPGLFKRCPGGNFHWRWDKLCRCRVNEHIYGPHRRNWHGGIYRFSDGEELGGE